MLTHFKYTILLGYSRDNEVCIRILLSLLSGLDKVEMTLLEFNKDDLGLV